MLAFPVPTCALKHMVGSPYAPMCSGAQEAALMQSFPSEHKQHLLRPGTAVGSHFCCALLLRVALGLLRVLLPYAGLP